MFSKIKSLCKKFYKSRKLVASFVLAMMLAFSAFMSIGIKSEAAYTTAKFFFDITTLKSTCSPDSFPYFYIFKAVNGQALQPDHVDVDYGSWVQENVTIYPMTYYNSFNVAGSTIYSYKYLCLFTSEPLYCNDTNDRFDAYVKTNRIVLGQYRNTTKISSRVYRSNDGINWSFYNAKADYGLCTSDSRGVMSFNPKNWYLMSSYPIRQVYTGQNKVISLSVMHLPDIPKRLCTRR